MARWFLSYHSPDEALAKRLKAAIERKTSPPNVFFAPKTLRAGRAWSQQLAEQIALADAFILLVGESGVGDYQMLEYAEALDRWVKQQRIRPVFPLILVLLEGQTAPGLPFLRHLHWIVTKDPTSEDCIGRIFDATLNTNDTPISNRWRYTSPYRGLEAMDEKDSDYFFGRTQETVQIIKVIANAGRLPILIGNSGVGKSSLAKAGVLSALKRQAWPEEAGQSVGWPMALDTSRQWCFLSFKPGADPLTALVEAFVDTWQFPPTDPERVKQQYAWVEILRDRKATLADLIKATDLRRDELSQTKSPTFFLYVDQGEELYVCSGETERKRFSELLTEALPGLRLRAMMSLRSDFFGHLQRDSPLFDAREHVDVPPLGPRELRQVVARPAQILDAAFETTDLIDNIVEHTLEDSSKDNGALPLLSYTLDDMWRQMIARNDGTLRLSYPTFDLGRVLVSRANLFLAEHPISENRIRRVFLKLVTVHEDGKPTRRRAFRTDFSTEDWLLICELANFPYRLLVTASADDRAEYVEAAHETIFWRWEKLRDWTAAEREFLAWRSGLESAQRYWRATPDPIKNEALLMGLPLALAQSWLKTRADEISKVDREFVVRSRRAAATRVRMAQTFGLAVLIAAIATYVLVADAGVQIPSGAWIREVLDQYDASVFRPVRSTDAVIASSRIGRLNIVNRLNNEWRRKDWIYTTPTRVGLPSTAISPWISSQAAYAIVRGTNPPEAEADILRDMLNAPFVGGFPTKLGWLVGGTNYPQAQPALWTISALAAAVGRAELFKNSDVSEFRKNLEMAETIAGLYYPTGDGGWNVLPNQVDQSAYSTSATALALGALLELRSAKLGWHGDDSKLAEMISQASKWLISKFDRTGQEPGWRIHLNDLSSPDTGEISEGLTLQIYSELLRAEDEAHVIVPPPILRAISAHLDEFVGRSSNYPNTKAETFRYFKDADGRLNSAIVTETHLWYPWSIELSARWLDRLNRIGGPPEEKVRARRALGYLLVDLGREQLRSAASNKLSPTFFASETLYSLTTVQMLSVPQMASERPRLNSEPAF